MDCQTVAKLGRVDAKHFSSIRKLDPTSLLGEPPDTWPTAADEQCVRLYIDNHAAHSPLSIVLLIASY
jgi:hypothetical protein